MAFQSGKYGWRLLASVPVLLSVALAGCETSGPAVKTVAKRKSTEYFAEAEYGVKASPRVVNVAMASSSARMTRLPRGGGRDQVGKPYKVKGKWYVPKEDPNYRAAGAASWYGDAFHGRLTANGEIYDMNHLSAAHPTMPLPSYARVTNKANGSSVIVRVNDRGPYAHGRVIDLSRRAAELLGYINKGTANVVVEYVGRAPVDGADDEYLMASYVPGNGGQGETAPAVMVASNALPGVEPEPVLALSGGEVLRGTSTRPSVEPYDPFVADGAISEPAGVPLPVNRPSACLPDVPCDGASEDSLLSGYAARPEHGAVKAFDSIMNAPGAAVETILVGSFDARKAKLVGARLKGLATLRFETGADGQVTIMAKGKSAAQTDRLLKAIWRAGYTDAFVIR